MKNRIEKIAKIANNFYNSKQAILFFMSLVSIFIILQFILFGFGIININKINVNDNNAWIIWTMTTISGIGSFLGFYGGILIIKMDKKFLPFLLLNSLGNLTAYIISRSFFLMIVEFFIIIMFIFRYKNFDKEKNKFNLKTILLILACILLFLIIGLLFVNIESISNKIYGEKTPMFIRWFDVLSGVLIVTGIIFMNQKSRFAFLFYEFSSILTIIIFIYHHNIILIIELLMYSIMDLTAFLSWTHEIKNL